ncbi:MAG: hypothetical protein [Caudoviricetes sp.]|nr:MAG: hypothetical protein [Caudoviricetes sp.]
MKICLICKTPIEDGLDIMTESGGHVHMGQCKAYHDELIECLKEGEHEEDLLAETQLLM